MNKNKYKYLITYTYTRGNNVLKGNNYVSVPKKLNTSERIYNLKRLLASYENVAWEGIIIDFIYKVKK